MLTRADALTPEQRAIVEAGLDGPFIVDAGAGTGKTYTLVRRAARLVRDGVLESRELLVVTFTKKAANEIAERLTSAFAEIGAYELPACGTFHAIAAALLREFAYETGDSPDLRAIDDVRARGIFRTAYGELLSGALGADTSALPILDREDVLVRDLASLAFELKNAGVSVDAFEREALAAVPSLRELPFGNVYTAGTRTPRKDQQPARARTPAERAAEAEREARNVRAVATLLRRFDALLAADGLLTYGDLLSRAVAMLARFPRIAERVRARWRHALVDEFQDTNPQQLAFLRAIFGDALGPVMAVGDVRQAIYEWNGADPLGIVRLAAAPGTSVFPLTRNRRSFQEILDAAHALLPADGPGSAATPLTAHAGSAPHAAVRHGVFADGGNVASCRAAEASAIADEIAALVARGERPRDIAILLRSRPSARTYAAALRERGIASRTHGGVGFFDAPEIEDCVAWFRLAVDPADRAALTRVLQSPVVGFSDGTVARLFTDARDAEPAEVRARERERTIPAWLLTERSPAWLDPAEARRFERFRAILALVDRGLALPVADAVRTTLRETAVDAAHAALAPDAAAQIRANVAKLTALADGFAQDRPLARLADFVAEIDEREQLEDDESEAELGGDEIAIMTIHAAKGLEWTYVFVANVTPPTFPSRRGEGEIVVVRDPHSHALAFRYGADGATPLRWYLRDPHDPLNGCRRREPKSGDAEERRLAYVALTRAKHTVWISGSQNGKQRSAFLDAIAGHVGASTPHAVFPSRADDASRGAAVRAPVGVAAPREFVARMRARLARTPVADGAAWNGKLSYSAISTFALCPRLARYRYVLRVPDFRDRPDITERDGDDVDGAPRKLDAATFGNLVHRVLEVVTGGRIAGRTDDLAAAVDDALAAFACDGDGALRARTTRAAARALDVLRPFEPIAVEEAFETTIGGVRVGGYLDLIARDACGEVWIVDYKTGSVPDAAYALQLALYGMALRPRYPLARLALLRIADESATLVEPMLPDDDAVIAAVREAAPMDRDEPRPGVHCRTCAYAGPLCPEGDAANR